MRVALILPGLSRDAGHWAIPSLQHLATELAQKHDITLFSLRYPEEGIYRFAGLTHVAMGGGNRTGIAAFFLWWRTILAIVRRHRTTPFHLLHSFWIDEPAFTAGIAAHLLRKPLLASAAGGELVYLPDIQYGTQRSRVRRLMTRLSLALATSVTAGSEALLDRCLSHGARPGTVRLAPLGIDTNQFKPADESPASPTVIQAASLSPVKNQGLLLEVLRQVRQQIPGVRLIMAGEGPCQQTLQQQAQALNVDDLITWRGKVDHADMAAVYQQAHIYLQSSRYEAQGVSVLEAFSCGLPVLGTPVGLLPQIAALPPQERADLLARQVVELLLDQELYRKHSTIARRRAENEYSLPLTAERFTQLYLACIQQQRRR